VILQERCVDERSGFLGSVAKCVRGERRKIDPRVTNKFSESGKRAICVGFWGTFWGGFDAAERGGIGIHELLEVNKGSHQSTGRWVRRSKKGANL